MDRAWGWIWRAWRRLDHERPYIVTGIGQPMGATMIVSQPGRIPWTAVDRWCRAHGYSDDDRQFLDACVEELDSIKLADWAEKQRQP
ncbi:hypothetical protein HMPREF9946_02233 [Acetobacteraceae bacterium AT-5844]|nr:hypothetical protein HMPREF9946_02233 [Acetobacteraceae bacterium AT-5844]